MKQKERKQEEEKKNEENAKVKNGIQNMKKNLSTINYTDDDGNTKLHLAVIENNIIMLRVLLHYSEVNCNIRNNEGNTPLHLAISQDIASKDKINIIYILLRSYRIDANIKNKAGDIPLHLAITTNIEVKDKIPIINILINKSRSTINIQNSEGNTPLHLAISENIIEIVLDILLRDYTDITIKNNEGNTPSELANSKNNIEIITLFEKNEMRITLRKKIEILSTDPNIYMDVLLLFNTKLYYVFEKNRSKYYRADEYYNKKEYKDAYDHAVQDIIKCNRDIDMCITSLNSLLDNKTLIDKIVETMIKSIESLEITLSHNY